MKKANSNIKALFLTKYSREGASTRYRFLQYFPYLRLQGIECTLSPLTDAAYLQHLYAYKRGTLDDYARALARRIRALISLHRYDVVIVEYEILPYFPPVFEKMLTLLKVPYIVNYDDAVFYRYSRSSNAWVRALFAGKIDSVMRNARIVIGGNRFLADYAARAGARRVEMIPTVVDTDRYPAVPTRQNEVFTIGWIGSPSTAKYLFDIAPALAKVCEGGRGRVVLIGSGTLKLPGVPVEIRAWSEASEVNELGACDVGIMPLADGAWEKGKCGLKILQYMAAALPVVVSAVGVNGEIVEDGVTGFLVSMNDEWARSLAALRDNKSLRERMGCSGRAVVERSYSLESTAPKLASLIIEASGRK